MGRLLCWVLVLFWAAVMWWMFTEIWADIQFYGWPWS